MRGFVRHRVKVDFRIRSLDEGNEGVTASIGTNPRKHRCHLLEEL